MGHDPFYEPLQDEQDALWAAARALGCIPAGNANGSHWRVKPGYSPGLASRRVLDAISRELLFLRRAAGARRRREAERRQPPTHSAVPCPDCGQRKGTVRHVASAGHAHWYWECQCGREGDLARTHAEAERRWIEAAQCVAGPPPAFRLVESSASGTPRGRRRKLTTQHIEQAVQRLMAGEKDRDVAKSLGVGRSTLYRALRRFRNSSPSPPPRRPSR